MSRTILINATATKHGGALTILKGFLSAAINPDDLTKYIIFTGTDISEYHSDKIRIINISTNGFGLGGIKRFLWDFFGLFFYCRRNKISPDLIISFQNVGVFFPGIKQLIYYHQLIPLYRYNWKFYKRDEFLLFFYEKIYPIFISLSLTKRTHVVVQQEFLRELFSKRFNFNTKRIHVIVPDLEINFSDQINDLGIDKTKFNIFYPTDWPKYKNYDILFEAIYILKQKSPRLSHSIRLYITIDKNFRNLRQKTEKLKISENVIFLGRITYLDVVSCYKSVDSLVFPSYIETIGLPLIEAAYFGLQILVSDLNYAHTTLNNYPGAIYVQYDDAESWADGLIQISESKQKFKSHEIFFDNNSWKQFMQLANDLSDKKHN